MRKLSSREQWLLGLCFLTIFLVGNGFVFRVVYKKLNGSEQEIERLQQEVAEYKQWAADREIWEPRDLWLGGNMPPPMVSAGKAQGELAQFLQDDLFERKIKIEKQSLIEPSSTQHYDEVAVTLRLRGDEKAVVEWLTTLQGPERFQVIKRLELSLDRKAKEKEPQAVCEITLARWFRPKAGGELMTQSES